MGGQRQEALRLLLGAAGVAWRSVLALSPVHRPAIPSAETRPRRRNSTEQKTPPEKEQSLRVLETLNS